MMLEQFLLGYALIGLIVLWIGIRIKQSDDDKSIELRFFIAEPIRLCFFIALLWPAFFVVAAIVVFVDLIKWATDKVLW